MIHEVDISDRIKAVAIHRLQQAAYAVEALRIGSADFPPLRETVEDLQNSTERFLVLQADEVIDGAISFEHKAESVVITRLVVRPERFRRGVATALLNSMEAKVPTGAMLCVITAEPNEPAIRCYAKQGYRVTAHRPSPEGIWLVQLEKQRNESAAH